MIYDTTAPPSNTTMNDVDTNFQNPSLSDAHPHSASVNLKARTAILKYCFVFENIELNTQIF